MFECLACGTQRAPEPLEIPILLLKFRPLRAWALGSSAHQGRSPQHKVGLKELRRGWSSWRVTQEVPRLIAHLGRAGKESSGGDQRWGSPGLSTVWTIVEDSSHLPRLCYDYLIWAECLCAARHGHLI